MIAGRVYTQVYLFTAVRTFSSVSLRDFLRLLLLCAAGEVPRPHARHAVLERSDEVRGPARHARHRGVRAEARLGSRPFAQAVPVVRACKRARGEATHLARMLASRSVKCEATTSCDRVSTSAGEGERGRTAHMPPRCSSRSQSTMAQRAVSAAMFLLYATLRGSSLFALP